MTVQAIVLRGFGSTGSKQLIVLSGFGGVVAAAKKYIAILSDELIYFRKR